MFDDELVCQRVTFSFEKFEEIQCEEKKSNREQY